MSSNANPVNGLNAQQAHKLMIVYMMLTSPSIGNGDFNKPSPDPTVPGTYQDYVNSRVADIPGAANALNQWLQGDATGNRNAGTKAATYFVNLAGPAWGGPNGCPLDIDTMDGWLNNA